MKSIRRTLAETGTFVVLYFACCAVVTWPFMWLWNYAVVAAVTVTQPIGYYPAYCLLLFLVLFWRGRKGSAK